MRRLVLLLLLAAALTLPGGAAGANGWWTFDRDTNLKSKLTWKWTYPDSPKQYSKSWRGGSGTTRNECEIGKGWLPAGWYAQWGHWNGYDGSAIKGRVFWLQDKYCSNGVTKRTELFIHTEETASRGQHCTSVYDDPFCWEREADFYSAGCIKLSRPSPATDPDWPNAIKGAHRTYHDYGGSGKHGAFKDANELYVFT